MTLRAGILALALLLVTATQAVGATASLREAGGSRFPDRSFVLTLDAPRDLRPGDVDITEDGRAVSDLSVTPAGAAGGNALASVLVIDASNSMRGTPIAAAMDAARAFAAERRTNQPLGVVFFSREARVGLPLTTSVRRIRTVLANAPTLSKGTQFRDASITALELLQQAKVDAGSIVVLSDGADAGSSATVEAVREAARATKAQVFTVGLRSPSYDGAALEELSLATGGSHTTATGGELRRVFSGLGAQLAGQYLIDYRSLSPLGSTVTVQADVAGASAPLTASYETPTLEEETIGGTTATESPAPSVLVPAIVIALAAFLVAWLLMRRPSRTVSQRVGDYGLSRPEMREAARRSRPSIKHGPKKEQAAVWSRFVQDLELAGVRVAPAQVALVVLIVTAMLAYLALAADRSAAAALFLLTPVAFVALIRSRVSRRRREFSEQLADTLQVVASAMRAGHSFSGALAVAVQDADEPMRTELGRVVRDEQLGVSIEKATAEGARRMASAELEQVGMVAALQREAGGNTAEVIDHLTETIRERDLLRRLVRTLTAQGRTAGIALSLLPIVLSAFFAIATPDYFDAMLDSNAGRLMLFAGAALIAAGWLAIRKVVDIKI